MSLFKTSVDGIISDLMEKVSKLYSLSENLQVEEQEHLAKAIKHKALADNAQNESKRAISIAEKISNLLT